MGSGAGLEAKVETVHDGVMIKDVVTSFFSSPMDLQFGCFGRLGRSETLHVALSLVATANHQSPVTTNLRFSQRIREGLYTLYSLYRIVHYIMYAVRMGLIPTPRDPSFYCRLRRSFGALGMPSNTIKYHQTTPLQPPQTVSLLFEWPYVAVTSTFIFSFSFLTLHFYI